MPPAPPVPTPSSAALLDLTARGEIKRWGAWLDAGGRGLRAELVALACARGADLPSEADSWAGKRLLRACLDRADRAQIRTTPIARDEAFLCTKCGRDVPLGGRRPRDHCPWCLYSLHVDDVPGDRASTCGGLLVPTRVEPATKGLMIVYQCAVCGMFRRNRVLDDLEPPDDLRVVREWVVRLGSSG